MQDNTARHAVHAQLAGNIARLRSRLRDRVALERDRGILFRIEKLRTDQVIVPFANLGVDALDLNPGRDRGTVRMFPIDLDGAGALREAAGGCAEKLMRGE
jgi:hypothetical protein